MTPGAAHIDRVCRDITSGVPGRDPATRLLAAADLAGVLDAAYDERSAR